MPYTKNAWVDEILDGDEVYEVLQADGDPIVAVGDLADAQINLTTTVLTPGTPLSAAYMNNIENKIEALADAFDAITTAGTSTAYTVNTNGDAAYASGERLNIKIHTLCGASPTLNRDGLGAKSLKYLNPAGNKVAVKANQLLSGMFVELQYDGTDYVVENFTGNLDVLTYEGTAIAAAGTTDIGASTGVIVGITGNTTITSFGTVELGVIRVLKFTGTPLLTYNATSLKLPGAANYQVVAGDVFWFESEGSGNWKCVGYALISGEAIVSGGGGVVHQTLTDGATINWDMDDGSSAQATMAGNRTFAAPTNLTQGQVYQLRLIQDGTGDRVPTFNAVFKNIPLILTAPNAEQVLSFSCDGTNLYCIGNSNSPIIIYKRTTETIDNTGGLGATLQNDAELLFPGVAGAVYEYEMVLFITAAGTAQDFKCGWATMPASATMLWGSLGGDSTQTGNHFAPTNVGNSPGALKTATDTMTSGSISGTWGIAIKGKVIMSSTPGDIQFQWAMNTATAANLSVLVGSYIEVKRVR